MIIYKLMMNIFQYLDYYIKNHGTTYGSIGNKDESLNMMLTKDEKQIYEQIQKSDRDRLLRFS